MRTQGWLLIQWTAAAPRGRAQCEAHADLFRVSHGNGTRAGTLREELVPLRDGDGDDDDRAARPRRVLQRLRRRLGRVVQHRSSLLRPTARQRRRAHAL